MMKTMAEYIDLDTPLELKAVWGSTYKPYTSTLRELLDVNHIPYTAADVRPVVRGKWKVSVHKTYYDVSCSVCGINSFFQVDEKDSVSYANYCPNCGANMEES